jgi:site-specific DNA-cytosine methylase
VSLVLSIFPGIGILDYAFECEGFTVVRGPDPLWGGDIRRFQPPAGRFDGIIGGDPCQSHSSLANLVRAKGLEPSFPDLTPEYQRVVEEARPAWFLRENVPKAPDVAPKGYSVRSFMLDNSTLDSGDGWGNEQMRRRRFWFGVRDGECPELRRWIDFALFELPDASPAVASDGRFGHRVNDGTGGTVEGNFRAKQQAVAGDSRAVPVAIGGSVRRKVPAVSDGGMGQRVKVTAVGGNDGTADAIDGYRKARDAGVDYSPPRRTLAEMLRLQGLPEGWIGHQPWTMTAMRKAIGNGVAVPTGRALARAIRKWLDEQTLSRAV